MGGTEAWYAKSVPDQTKRKFSIVDKATGKVIGMTGLIGINARHRKAQFYSTIGEKEFWGHRIADEAIAIVLHYGFVELDLNRVFLYTISGNDRARKVYQRNGFVPEGVLRVDSYCVGRPQDIHVHGMLKREWLEIKDTLSVRFG